MRPRTACLLALLGLAACEPRELTATPDEAGDGSEAEAGAETADADDAGALDDSCPAPARFEDLAWVPGDARLLTRVDRSDGQALAGALDQLAALADDPRAQLPVYAAMDFKNLALQLGNLDRLLAELGSDPDELAELHGPGGELLWVWPISCPAEVITARALARWELMLRADLEHPGVRLGAGDPERFPFDVLLVGERRLVLTTAGRGRDALAWLASEASVAGEATHPAEALAELEAAPIRAVLTGEALLGGSQATAATADARRIRATATGVELDGKPWPPP